MGVKRYIADWHYGHANILAYDNRPFLSVERMDEALVERWNRVVASGDLTYVLGDMFWCGMEQALPVLNALNGQKILVKGNHDRCDNARFNNQFEKVADYLEINDNGRKIVLCHYPIPCFKNHFYGWYHLYGHVHASFEHSMMLHDRRLMEELYGAPCRMYNVGAMLPYMDYTPRTLDEILSANPPSENGGSDGP